MAPGYPVMPFPTIRPTRHPAGLVVAGILIVLATIFSLFGIAVSCGRVPVKAVAPANPLGS